MNKTKKKVFISKTNREWEVIDKRVKEFFPNKDFIKIEDDGKGGKKRTDLTREYFNRYVGKKIISLLEDYENCPHCVSKAISKDKSERQKFLNDETYMRLFKMSNEIGVPVSTIVDRLIITPLLIEK